MFEHESIDIFMCGDHFLYHYNSMVCMFDQAVIIVMRKCSLLEMKELKAYLLTQGEQWYFR